MATCDVCEQEVAELAASRRGKYKMNLCKACWEHTRKRQSPPSREQVEAAIRADGPPYVWPLCELCGQSVDQHGLGLYTKKGKQRRFCSRLCRNTNNSRVGNPVRLVRLAERIRQGAWQNPGDSVTDEQRREFARKGGAANRERHLAALEAGAWQNPADAPGAHEKLSRPRVHGDNPLLHSAIEKLRSGRMTNLDPDETKTYRAYRRNQQRRLRQQPVNTRFREARQQLNLSQAEVARRLGVASNTVWRWENHSAVPQSVDLRERIASMFGVDPFQD